MNSQVTGVRTGVAKAVDPTPVTALSSASTKNLIMLLEDHLQYFEEQLKKALDELACFFIYLQKHPNRFSPSEIQSREQELYNSAKYFRDKVSEYRKMIELNRPADPVHVVRKDLGDIDDSHGCGGKGKPLKTVPDDDEDDDTATTLEMARDARRAIRQGLQQGESYKRYSQRLGRLLRDYKVSQSPARASLLELMKVMIPSDVLNIMTMAYSFDVRSGDRPPDPDSHPLRDGVNIRPIMLPETFVTYLEAMEGPEDCDERKRLRASLAADLDTNERPGKRMRASHKGIPNITELKMCTNGCGLNPTHDTAGCIVCGNCKNYGHIASTQ
ncbi:hypothetical protein BGW42_008711 [Actinomortierella wolfii]|nr:hypothetical protein BGW42_008711 [Actinomortierella wolfii]